jgi:hypothetical protein
VEPHPSKAIAYRPKRAALNWVDYLVIAATALTFLAVVAANNPHVARAESRTNLLTSADLPAPGNQGPLDPALLKARIALALRQM